MNLRLPGFLNVGILADQSGPVCVAVSGGLGKSLILLPSLHRTDQVAACNTGRFLAWNIFWGSSSIDYDHTSVIAVSGCHSLTLYWLMLVWPVEKGWSLLIDAVDWTHVLINRLFLLCNLSNSTAGHPFARRHRSLKVTNFDSVLPWSFWLRVVLIL